MPRLRYDRDGSVTVEDFAQPTWTEPCDRGHEFCEGSTLHIRGRCVTGCPQFQDGSWFARDFCSSIGNAHPGRHGGTGEAEAVKAWLEASFAQPTSRGNGSPKGSG